MEGDASVETVEALERFVCRARAALMIATAAPIRSRARASVEGAIVVDDPLPAWLNRGSREHTEMFACKVCGVECTVSPGPGQAVCEAHCEDHDYGYERGEGHRCKHCHAEPPHDWFDEN